MARKRSKQKTSWDRASDFLWRDRSEEPRIVQWMVGYMRALFFAFRGFFRHQLPLRASALTFVTLLSLIPILALTFSAAKGLGFGPNFGYHDDDAPNGAHRAAPTSATRTIATAAASTAITTSPLPTSSTIAPTTDTAPTSAAALTSAPLPNPLDPFTFAPTSALTTTSLSAAEPLDEKHWTDLIWDSFVRRLTADQKEIRTRIEAYVDSTNFGTLKAIGIILLIVTTLIALGAMEETFNTIWHVRYSRSLLRQFTDYLSVVVICPILVFAAIATAATFSSSALARQFYQIDFLNEIMGFFLASYSFISIWAALTFLYWFLPNTRVKLHYAAIGGLVAGIVWQGAFLVYSTSMSSMNVIYASLAALPFFLTWIYFSWVIVLFGAEVAAAFQNREVYERDVMMGEISPAERLRVGLNLMLTVCTRFWREEPAWTADQLARYLECSIGRIEEILDTLADAGMLAASGHEKPPKYQPAVPLENISPARVIEALQEKQHGDTCGNATPEAISARSLIEQWREGLWRELGTVGFDVLVEEIQRAKALPAPPEMLRHSAMR